MNEQRPSWEEHLCPLESGALTVLVDISNKCNIRCRMCHFAFDSVFFRRQRYMSPESFRSLAEALFPFAHTVYLSAGNESMTSPHFIEILRIAGEYGIVDLKFLTNGLLMGPRVAEAILGSGVTQVHLSVDGATKETYEAIRNGGRFEVLLENVRYLAARKEELGRATPLLQFNVTLMRSNLEELEALVDLAEELGVTRIAARHMMPYEGLDLEGESLSCCPERANRSFRKFLARIAASPSVTLGAFPDLFEEEETEPRSAHGAPACTDDASHLVGALDHPRGERLPGSDSILFSGWALDRYGEVEVLLLREPVPEDAPESLDESGFVVVGRGEFINGSRPDVGALYPDFPLRYRNAWRFELTREQLPSGDSPEVELIVVARGTGGAWLELGRRIIDCGGGQESPPYLFCDKPFRSVYVDSVGNIYPYPDCQAVNPLGVLGRGVEFPKIWFGGPFTRLRQQIIDRAAPRMCRTCPDFINRNVDDPTYFEERDIESVFQLPLGFIEKLIERDGALRFVGWMLFGEGAPTEVVIETPSGRRFTAAPWYRPDLAAIRPHLPEEELVGFTASLPVQDLPVAGRYALTLRMRRGSEEFACTVECARGTRWRGDTPLGPDRTIVP